MRQGSGAWCVLGFVLALSACEDEILTDVDLPKADAAADRAADAPGGDSGRDDAAEMRDGKSPDAGDFASPMDSGADAVEAPVATDGSADATVGDAAQQD